MGRLTLLSLVAQMAALLAVALQVKAGTQCPYTSLRQVLRDSAENSGLSACTTCTLDIAACSVTCASCAAATGHLSGSTTLRLSDCRQAPSTFTLTLNGQLACEPVSPIKTLAGHLEVFVSHGDTPETWGPENLTFVINPESEDGSRLPRASFRIGNGGRGADMLTGDQITLTYRSATQGGRRRLADDFCADDSFCLGEVDTVAVTKYTTSEKDFIIDDKPLNVTSITMLATVCGVKPKIPLERLRSWWFNDGPTPSKAISLQYMYSTCSYNKLSFNPDSNLITTVELPCRGTYYGQAYDSVSACGTPELYGWMDDALAQAVNNLKLQNVTRYKRRILVLPNRPSCPWPGLASVGCPVTCNTWLNLGPSGASAERIDLPTAFQELGHNIGLQHANRYVNWQSVEYEDFTDPMGSGGPRSSSTTNSTMMCMNAAQAWKAGWSHPLKTFNFTSLWTGVNSLGYGQYNKVALPPMALSDKNFVLVNISSLPDYQPTWPANALPIPQVHQLFISYRVRQAAPGYDSGLDDTLNMKLYIHHYNSSARSPPRPDPNVFDTVLEAIVGMTPAVMLRGGQVQPMYRRDFGPLPGSPTKVNGLSVIPVDLNAAGASFKLCFFQLLTEAEGEDGCGNGLDEDCDGLMDGDDPDCGGSAASPPPRALLP